MLSVLGSDAPESQPEYVEYLRRDRAAVITVGEFGSCLNRRRLDVYERAALTAWREKGRFSGPPVTSRTTREFSQHFAALRFGAIHLGTIWVHNVRSATALRTANCAIFLMKFGGADLSLWTRNGCTVEA